MKQLNVEYIPIIFFNCTRFLTSKPHMAGTRADLEQAEYIRKLWEDQGLDEVKLTSYNVVLSFPKTGQNSKVGYTYRYI